MEKGNKLKRAKGLNSGNTYNMLVEKVGEEQLVKLGPIGPRQREVINKLVEQPDGCIRLFRDDGKTLLFASEAWAYQRWGMLVIKRLVNRGICEVVIKTNPITKRPVKYLCLKFMP